ncbi:hypothetical protein [Anaeromicrobium sediminis]|uniref:Uncharacterized protein n=1 Tax=Anaeromicrobium sediminis TaxID=1478221 RepID=A0A267MMU6_9FIRM|nr:hypothetical protein [Anaeromicrobium sediminis]PAB60732.1 hypothetical protein CCE28_04120 [Anaeromicrobium sediminis]
MGKNINNTITNAYAILAAVFAIIVAERLDLNQQNVFGNFIQTLGQSILTISAAGEQQEKANMPESKDYEMYYQIKMLKEQIEHLENKLTKKGDKD